MSSVRTYNATDLGIDLDFWGQWRGGGRQGRRDRGRLVRTVRSRGSRYDVSARPDDLDEWVHITGCRPWTKAEHDAVAAGRAPCPACGRTRMLRHQADGVPGAVPAGDRDMRPDHLCECDRCGCDPRLPLGADGLPLYPGLRVSEALDPEWVPEDRPAYAPDPKLAGGKGRKAARAAKSA
jgi:hypothetical protein